MQPSETIGFHESSIVGISQSSATVTIELEGVHLGEEAHPAAVRLIGVKSITRDGIDVRDLVMEYVTARSLRCSIKGPR
jgi:hypothetical protein